MPNYRGRSQDEYRRAGYNTRTRLTQSCVTDQHKHQQATKQRDGGVEIGTKYTRHLCSQNISQDTSASAVDYSDNRHAGRIQAEINALLGSSDNSEREADRFQYVERQWWRPTADVSRR